MCESCFVRSTPSPTGHRLKLWEVERYLHCSIIGTCLSLSTLAEIARKAGFVQFKTLDEYGVHNYFVQQAEKPVRITRLMQKALDTRYRTAINAYRLAKSEDDLVRLWSRSLEKGDIPGPFWALVTHPAVTDPLVHRAFGEVHMLSHLTGATNRADIRRLRRLETELDGIRRSMTNQAAEFREAADRHAAEMAEMKRRLDAAVSAEAALDSAEARLLDFESGGTYRDMECANARLTNELESARRDCARIRQHCDRLERELSNLRQAHEKTTTNLDSLVRESSALEAMLQSGAGFRGDQDCSESPALDLSGRRIAYVGGRSNTINHIRTLIEGMNGSFCHHDGGLDDNLSRLGGVLSQADLVLCPVDCVSHGACLKAKAFCKQSAKPFVPLRSASLSSLVCGIQQAVSAGEGAPEAR